MDEFKNIYSLIKQNNNKINKLITIFEKSNNIITSLSDSILMLISNIKIMNTTIEELKKIVININIRILELENQENQDKWGTIE